MSHRSRVRLLGLGMVVVTVLTSPLMYQFSDKWGMLRHLMIVVLGGLLLRSANAAKPSSLFPGLASALFGYWACHDLYSVWQNSWHLSLSSISSNASGLFIAWCSGIAALMMLSAATTKRSWDSSSPVPALATSWGLGAVAALNGISGILQPGQDGWISTGIAIAFAFTLLGLGILLLRGRQPVAASYGIGLATSLFAGWTFFTNDAFDFLINFIGRASTWGAMGALVVFCFLGSVMIGNEIAANAGSARAKAK